MNNGDLAILNCSDGDTRLSFNSDVPDEVARAKVIVEDMLKRGYCISIVVGDKMERVKAFGATKNEYVIDAPDPEAPAKRRGGRRKGVPTKSTRAYAVAPTAGGGLGVRAFPLRRSQLAKDTR